MRVRWKRSTGDYVESHCGRWWITPIYGGCPRPERYELRLDDRVVGGGLPPVVYTWAIDAALGRPEIRDACGEERTLRVAKRRVEAAFRRLYSWRFPASRGY